MFSAFWSQIQIQMSTLSKNTLNNHGTVVRLKELPLSPLRLDSGDSRAFDLHVCTKLQFGG